MLFYLFPAPVGIFILYRLYRLAKNYLAARKLGLPIITLPVSYEDQWWMPIRPLFKWVKRLPFGLGDWYFYTEFGWPMPDGIKTVSRLGETFILVSPSRNQICTAYPPAVDAIFKDMKTWILPLPFSQLFTTYGQNVSSLNGADWQRHRKVTASAFKEQTMRQVWEEAQERTAVDLRFLSDGRCNLKDMRSGFNVLAMHVLAAVGFGQETELGNVPPGHRQTLME